MAETGGVLALDLSLRTGWAYGCAGETPRWGHWPLGKMAEEGYPGARLMDHLCDAVEWYAPRLIAYEAPLIPIRQSQASVGFLLIGLAEITKAIAVKMGVAHAYQRVDEVRIALLGKALRGRPAVTKPPVIAWCRRRGWQLDEHENDEADALMLWAYATVQLDRSERSRPNNLGDVL